MKMKSLLSLQKTNFVSPIAKVALMVNFCEKRSYGYPGLPCV
jgi:hypothetical protein